uniref:C2H2-type domain-containing protein n=1 Tax=Strigamia maritima TaxID=126957 RepID=T1ISU2_STRMM
MLPDESGLTQRKSYLEKKKNREEAELSFAHALYDDTVLLGLAEAKIFKKILEPSRGHRRLVMAVFLINICKFNGCGIKFPTLGDLIQHIEDTHLDYDPRVLEKQESQQPSCLPLSYILRFFTDAARKENLDILKRKQRALSPAVSIRSTTPTGSEFDDDEVLSESEDSDDSWTTQEEFSSEFILRYGSRMMRPSNSNEEKPFACPVPGCKKRYKNVNGIKYHAKNGHRKDARVKKAFKCQCGKNYKTSKGLRNHAMVHHGNGEVVVSNADLSEVSIASISPSVPKCSSNLVVTPSSISMPICLPTPTCIPNAMLTPPPSASPQPIRPNPLQAGLVNYSPLTPTSPNTPNASFSAMPIKISVPLVKMPDTAGVVPNGVQNRSRDSKTAKEPAHLLTSCRLVISVMAFFGCVITYILRLNLGFAMVCMVHKPSSDDSIKKPQDDCWQSIQNQNDSLTDSSITTAEFNWSKSLQGSLLGAFFYGYILTQIPAGWLCEKFGAKITLSIGLGVTSFLTLLIPMTSRVSPFVLLAVRLLQGMFAVSIPVKATAFPAVHSLIGKWAPSNERGLLLNLAYSGIYVGTIITFPASGLLCKHGFAGGWPSVFYVSGAIGLVWILGIHYFVYDTYIQHPRISKEEKLYLKNAGLRNYNKKNTSEIPWGKFFNSGPVWAIIMAHLTANWGLYTLVINLPTYMDNIHKFRIKENGFLSALPYVSTLIVTLVSGKMSDFLIRRKFMSTTAVRKTFNSFGMFIPCVCMYLLTTLNCTQRFYAVAVIVVLQTFSGLAYSGGFFLNHVDIAPQFAGILMGITNLFGTVPGIASPIIVGFVTPNGTLQEWSIVFYIGMGAYAFGGLFYLLFASGKEQDWIFDPNELQMEEINPGGGKLVVTVHGGRLEQQDKEIAEVDEQAEVDEKIKLVSQSLCKWLIVNHENQNLSCLCRLRSCILELRQIVPAVTTSQEKNPTPSKSILSARGTMLITKKSQPKNKLSQISTWLNDIMIENITDTAIAFKRLQSKKNVSTRKNRNKH